MTEGKPAAPRDLRDVLLAEAKAAVASRGHLDYRRSWLYAADAHRALDKLEAPLDARGGTGRSARAGTAHADAARPALLHILTTLQRVSSTRADDSSGEIGAASQRALDLHARSCREGTPDPKALARWLVKFRDSSPGWPRVALADYAPAFDERAFTAYRAAVEGVVARHRAEDLNLERAYDARVMLLELADHDGDLGPRGGRPRRGLRRGRRIRPRHPMADPRRRERPRPSPRGRRPLPAPARRATRPRRPAPLRARRHHLDHHAQPVCRCRRRRRVRRRDRPAA